MNKESADEGSGLGSMDNNQISAADGEKKMEVSPKAVQNQQYNESHEPRRQRRDGRRRHRGPIGMLIHALIGVIRKDKNKEKADTAISTTNSDEHVYESQQDLAHAASKRRSWYAVLLAGFAMALDFTMAMMSIQTLYYALKGPDRLYGLTFGSYDLTGIISAPIFGMWSDRIKGFKIPTMAGIVTNVIGNVVYGFCFLADAWWMMLLGRLIAGVATAILGLGSAYIAATTTFERRQVALVRYRVSQSIARIVGPFFGYFFLGLPDVNQNSSVALRVFNWYTSPGWIAALLAVLVLVVFWVLFVDPTFENKHLLEHELIQEEEAIADGNARKDPEVIKIRTAKFNSFFWIWCFLAMMQSLLQFAFYSTIFSLFAGQYHAIGNQTDQWKVFIGLGIGAAVTGFLYRRMIRLHPALFNERLLTCLASILMFVVYMLVIPYHGEEDTPPHAIFYAASALAGSSIVLSSSSLETVFSKKVTQYIGVTFWGSPVKDIMAKLFGYYFMATAAGRFAGPLIAGSILRIATPDGNVFYCPDESVNADGSIFCSEEGACAITPDNYYTDGCILHGSTVFYSVFASVQFLVACGFMFIVRCYWSYND